MSRPGFWFQLGPRVPVHLWASHTPFLSLSFPICKVKVLSFRSLAQIHSSRQTNTLLPTHRSPPHWDFNQKQCKALEAHPGLDQGVGLLGEHEGGKKNTMQFYFNICNYPQAKNKAQSKVFSNVGINEHFLSNIMWAPECIYVRFLEISEMVPHARLAFTAWKRRKNEMSHKCRLAGLLLATV